MATVAKRAFVSRLGGIPVIGLIRRVMFSAILATPFCLVEGGLKVIGVYSS